VDWETFMSGVFTGFAGGIASLLVYHIKFASKTIERLVRIETKIDSFCRRLERLEEKLKDLDTTVDKHSERLVKLESKS